MHYAAASYPVNPIEKQIQEMKSWLECLATTIPCKDCAKHFAAYIEKHKHQLYDICSSRHNLFHFLVDIHNKVNERLGRPIMSYENAYKLYNYTSECKQCK